MTVSELIRESVRIPVGREYISGDLTIPVRATAAVIFAHGSGSSRFSKRNRFVAEQLNQRGLTTLLFDLLTPSEDAVDQYSREYRFDIHLLTQRLVIATRWLQQQSHTGQFHIGYFGASTGAAAALAASAQGIHPIKAVVCRGGRPDLAGDALPRVSAPTLLIVGSNDYDVIELNRRAQARMGCINQLKIVPGASHLFEEAGTLEQAAKLAGDWFCCYL